MSLITTSQNDYVPHVHNVMIPLHQSIISLHLLLLLHHPPLDPLRYVEWGLLYHEEVILTLNYIGKLRAVEMISLFPRLCLLKVLSLILSSGGIQLEVVRVLLSLARKLRRSA
jgi:hypothetical protein